MSPLFLRVQEALFNSRVQGYENYIQKKKAIITLHVLHAIFSDIPALNKGIRSSIGNMMKSNQRIPFIMTRCSWISNQKIRAIYILTTKIMFSTRAVRIDHYHILHSTKS